MKKFLTYLPILLVLFAASVFRIYKLDSVPPSPSLDEVSYGYNAYSIMRTGKDEYGNFLPILMRAYDDYRPALYMYLVIPFINIFGLSSLSVRLPSAIFSVITVYAVYLLSKILFGKTNQFKIGNISIDMALLTMILFAISPWHIYISRLGHEASLGFSLYIIALFLIFSSIFNKNRRILLPFSAICFGLTLYTYQSYKIITPVSLFTFAFLFRKEIFSQLKIGILSFLILLILAIPITIASMSPDALIRMKGTSVFTDNRLYAQTDALWLKARIQNDIIGGILYHPKVTTIRIFIANYFPHFSFNWLFLNGNDERFKIPGLGLIYLWEVPLILLGIIGIFRANIDKKVKIYLAVWFLSGPLPAALSTQTPHAMRAYTMLPVFQFFSAFGLLTMLNMLISIKLKIAVMSFWLMIVIISTYHLYKQYFSFFSVMLSGPYQYALNKAVTYITSNEYRYNKIIISNEKNLSQSYMFYLFWNKYDPEYYLSQGGTKSGGFAVMHKIGKYEFRPIKWDKEQKFPNTLYVGNTDDFPNGIGIGHTIKLLNGKPAVLIIGS